jgi:hypothetical protein
MIDRRNIDYTEGTPLSPVIGGELLQTEPSVDIPSGEIVSRKTTPKEADSGIPDKVIDIFTQAPIVTGLETAADFWTLIFGSPEQMVDSLSNYLPIGDTSKEILEEKKEEMSKTGDWFTQPAQTLTSSVDFPEIKIPDITGGLKWLGIGLLALGGLYVLGKGLERRK